MLAEGRSGWKGAPDEFEECTATEVKNFIQGLESPRDDRTGTASQSIGRNRLLQEMSRLQRYQIPCSIVLLAMDNLEDVDRIAGHVVGQTVFKAFANHVTQSTYITDTCFRFDINKILVVLPDTNEDQAREFCRKLSRTMQSHALFGAIEPGKGFCYSVSAGVAQAKKGSGLDEMITAAGQTQAVFYECRN